MGSSFSLVSKGPDLELRGSTGQCPVCCHRRGTGRVDDVCAVAFVEDDAVLPPQGLYGATLDVCMRAERHG